MRSGEWSAGAKSLALTLDGAAVREDVISLTLTDDINGAEDPKIGSTCAARLSLTIQAPEHAYAGRTITAAVGGIPLGVFTVTETAAKDDRTVIEAVDAMATAFEAAYEPAGESSTALTVIRAIAAASGVTVGDVSGVTDVPVTGLAGGCTRREMLGLMAALLGRNVHMDREGKLCLRWYAPAATDMRAEMADGHVVLYGVRAIDEGDGHIRLRSGVVARDVGGGHIALTAVDGTAVTADDYYPGELTKADGDYGIDRIECTVRRTVRTTVDGTTTEETETRVYAAGEGATGISLTDEYMTQSILDGVYAQLSGLRYRPMTVTFYGDARIETGDILLVTDTAGATHTVPVMKVTHVWDGGVKTTVTACGNPAEGMSRSAGGYLSKSVSNLMAEFARFQTMEAENIEVLRGRIGELFADWANIGTAIIETLQASGINADWINAGRILAEYLRLYGSMIVYTDATLETPAGQIGFTTGASASDIGQGLVQFSAGGISAVIVGDSTLFLGFHSEADPWHDGGAIRILSSNYPNYIRFVDDLMDGARLLLAAKNGIHLNGRDVLAELGTLANLTTAAKGSLVAAVNEINALAAQNKGALADQTDLDTVTVPGWYQCAGTNTYTNLPGGITWGLLDVKTAGTFKTQELTTTNGRAFKRFYSNAAWSAWREM